MIGVNVAGKCTTLKKLETHAVVETTSEKPASEKPVSEGVSASSRKVDTGMTADQYSVACVFRRKCSIYIER